MGVGTDSQVADRWTQRPQLYAAWVALAGVVIGAVLTFTGQSILAAQSIEQERENRLWRERASAYGSFDLASYDFMRAAHDSDPDELKRAHERIRAGMGPVSILGGAAVAEAARVVHLAASVIFAAERPSERWMDDLSTARSDFKIVARKELGVTK